MEFKKTYVLYQFTCRGRDYIEEETFYVIRFKYPVGMNIDSEIKRYGEEYFKECRDKTFRKFLGILADDTWGVDKYYDFMKDFLVACQFDYEEITKQEYKEWKERDTEGCGKLTFV